MHFNAPVNFFLLEVTRNKVRDTDILWQKLSNYVKINYQAGINTRDTTKMT